VTFLVSDTTSPFPLTLLQELITSKRDNKANNKEILFIGLDFNVLSAKLPLIILMNILTSEVLKSYTEVHRGGTESHRDTGLYVSSYHSNPNLKVGVN
jgi:hypothetical protein